MRKNRFNQIFTAAVLATLLSAMFISCTTGKNSANGNSSRETVVKKPAAEDYSGTYKLSGEETCGIIIKILKDKDGYSFAINGAGVNSSGRLSVLTEEETVYLQFNDTHRSGDNSAIEGRLSGNRIIIQNYGNSLNNFILFQKCDVKYLEFERSR